jgi:hypothetical protein
MCCACCACVVQHVKCVDRFDQSHDVSIICFYFMALYGRTDSDMAHLFRPRPIWLVVASRTFHWESRAIVDDDDDEIL